MHLARGIFLFLITLAWINVARSQEQIRFGTPIRADPAQNVKHLLPLSTMQPPREIASGAEVILISGYEPASKSETGTTVKVEINRPDSKVLLVLTSYEKINWNVSAPASTKIAGIIVSGYHQPTVTTALATQGFVLQLPYATETENINFKELLARLNSQLGIEKLDVFRGSYSIPPTISISAIDTPRNELTVIGPIPQKTSNNFAFELVTTDFKRARWTLAGPESKEDKTYFDEGKVALSENGKVIFRLNGDQLEISDQSGGKPFVPTLPANFPKFSWAMDLAYDTKRDIVCVVTLGGEGFLYRFDARARQWIDFRSLKDIDIFSLSYDKKTDRYIAWTDQGSLLFISGEGNALFMKRVISRLEGFGRLYDRGNGRAPRILIAPNGDDIALVYVSGRTVKRIWHYSVKSESTLLTY